MGGCVDLLPSGVNLIGGDLASPMCGGVFQGVNFGPSVCGRGGCIDCCRLA